MQEDTFLQEYKQEWQQDNEAMSRLVDIPLETLHENIARYGRQKTYPGLTATPLKRGRSSRKIVWMTLSAAACLTFAVGIGLRYLTTNTPSPTLVAENRTVKPDTYPTLRQTFTEGLLPSQEGTKNVGTAQQAQQTSPATYSSYDSGKTIENSTPVIEEVAPVDVQPDIIVPAMPSAPAIDANAIETNRLVAMGETKASAIEIETEGLVKITAPSRNTFHEAIVEPLLALVTSDFN